MAAYDEKFRLQVTKDYMEHPNAQRIVEEHNVPIRTVYKWASRYRNGGEEALKKKSTKPIRLANETSEYDKRIIVATWQELYNQNNPATRSIASLRRELAAKGIDKSEPTLKRIITANVNSIKSG